MGILWYSIDSFYSVLIKLSISIIYIPLNEICHSNFVCLLRACLCVHTIPFYIVVFYFRKATRQVVDDWVVAHAASNSMNPPNSSQDLSSPTYAGGNYPQAKSSSGATTPVRKISAHEFERGGLLKPIVTTIDGYPTFLSVSPTREAPSECTSTQTTPVQTRPRRRSRNELKHLDEKELIFELVSVRMFAFCCTRWVFLLAPSADDMRVRTVSPFFRISDLWSIVRHFL